MDKKNVLIVYSCLQEGAFLQQNLSIVYQFVQHLKNYNITILTSFDTLKLAIQDEARIIVDKISAKLIIEIIKSEKIDLFIPIIGDIDNIIKKVQKHIKRLKVVNLYEDYYTNNTFLDYKCCRDINLEINHKNENDFKHDIVNTDFFNSGKILNALAIKDKFGNQVLLDILEYNGKTNEYYTWNSDVKTKRFIKQKIDKIGEFLKITNCLYNIKIITNNNKIFLIEIDYIFNDVALFFIQARQIDIGKMMLDIFNKGLIMHYSSIKECYTFNSKADAFIFKFLKTNIDVNEKYSSLSCTKKHDLLQQLVKNDIQNNFKLKYVKHNNIAKNDNKYILVSIDDAFIHDANIQILFYKLCDFLKRKTGYKILLLVKKNIILSSFLKNVDIIFYTNITNDYFKAILEKYNIVCSFIIPSKNNNILNMVSKNGIKLYCINKDEFDLFCSDEDALFSFCNNLNIPFQYDAFGYKENIFHYFCITDKNKNVSFSTIVSEHYQYSIATKCNIMPAIFANYDIDAEINRISDIIIDNLSSYGLLDITFIYNKGELFVNGISLFSDASLFFLQKLKKNGDVLFDILSTSALGEDIYKIVNSTKVKILEKFEKVCCFYNDNYNKQVVVVRDNTKNKILNRYKLLFAL